MTLRLRSGQARSRAAPPLSWFRFHPFLLFAGYALIGALPVAALALAPERLRPIDGEVGGDGYVFQQKAFSRLVLRLRVHEYRTRAALHRAVLRVAPDTEAIDDVVGFATFGTRGCDVYLLDPAVRYEPEVIGHELAHCLHGNFHPGQETAR